mgnify:CR=1 FL=1
MDKLTPEQIKAIKDKEAIKSKAVDNGKIIKK